MAQKNKDGRSTETSPVLRPINPEAMMGPLPAGSRNVLAKSLVLLMGLSNVVRDS